MGGWRGWFWSGGTSSTRGGEKIVGTRALWKMSRGGRGGGMRDVIGQGGAVRLGMMRRGRAE